MVPTAAKICLALPVLAGFFLASCAQPPEEAERGENNCDYF